MCTGKEMHRSTKGGAYSELGAGIPEGGTTPSYGDISFARSCWILNLT